MVDMKVGGRRMLAESYHPKRDHMNTSQTIGVLLAAGAILLPSCETERVNERPIGIYPTENVYPSGSGAMGAQGSSLLNEIQRENSLDPVAGQNSGFNPDPAQTNSGTIGNMVGGTNNITPPPPVAPKPVVPNPVSDSANSGIAAPRPVEPSTASSIPVAWPTADPTVVVVPTVPDLSGCGDPEICPRSAVKKAYQNKYPTDAFIIYPDGRHYLAINTFEWLEDEKLFIYVDQGPEEQAFETFFKTCYATK